MLSSSFIVSASPVLTRAQPLYHNNQLHLTQVDPYEAADQIYGLTSDSRRVKRSFSVGRSSDLELGRKTNVNNKRSVSQSRDPHSALSPIQRRPLPSVPSPSSPSSPSLYQRSLLSDIYSYTKDREYQGFYDKFYSEVESGDSSTVTRGRSRIPVALSSSKNVLKTRAVTQMDLKLKPKLSFEREDGDIVKKGLMWIQQDKMFSTWKERFVILTRTHMQIFKKGTTKFSDMGAFLNKVSLASVSQLSLEEKRGYLTLLLVTASPSLRLWLRRPDGLTDWLSCLRNISNLAQDREPNIRRQLSEYGTFHNISRASRNSLDESPCSSIGRPYSSPRQRPQSFKPGENLYTERRERIYQEPTQAHNNSRIRLNQAMFI